MIPASDRFETKFFKLFCECLTGCLQKTIAGRSSLSGIRKTKPPERRTGPGGYLKSLLPADFSL
jgi:hypothetical protein